jgi:membrane fusion protein (multidrug efflux system)
MVPERAVAELQGKNFVWVVDSDNKTSQRAVKVGETIGSNVMILEGLKPGERIVVEGLQKVREGAVVTPMAATTAGQAPSAPVARAEAKPAKE